MRTVENAFHTFVDRHTTICQSLSWIMPLLIRMNEMHWKAYAMNIELRSYKAMRIGASRPVITSAYARLFSMQQLPNWPEAAVVGTNVLLPSGEKQNPMREVTAFEEVFWPLEMVKQKLGVWDGYRSKDETGYCEKVSGCCFFIFREFLLKNNYLDENVFMYCEEPILAKCVKRMGFRELYIKELTANHEHYAAQKSGSSGKRMTEFLKSRTYYIENYSGYNKTLTKMAVFSRRIQSNIERYFK